MWQFFVFLSLVLTTTAIRVPVTSNEENPAPSPQSDSEESDEGSGPVDSYLIPQNPYMNDEAPPGNLVPLTYLIPPALNQRNYYTIESPSANINRQSVRQHIPINILGQKPIPYSLPLIVKDAPDSGSEEVHMAFEAPTRQLVPPFQAPSEHISYDETEKKASNIRTPASDFELPNTDLKNTFKPSASEEEEESTMLPPAKPTLALHLTPPKYGPVLVNSNIPTKLYPKKYGQTFRPIPIPIYQFADANSGIPIAKPLKSFMPADTEEVSQIPYNEKALYMQQQAEEKRRLKEQDNYRKQQELDSAVEQTYGKNPQDADASETSYGGQGHNVVHQPQSSGAPSDAQLPPVPPPGERTEFRMHGLNGPHSYQFGYDTGKGKNRQFRYEERDNDGRVKGHYGYMDRDGKMRVVNYGADPETGFHADPPKENP